MATRVCAGSGVVIPNTMSNETIHAHSLPRRNFMGASFACPGFAIQPAIGSLSPATGTTYAPCIFSVKADGALPPLPRRKLSTGARLWCRFLSVFGRPLRHDFGRYGALTATNEPAAR